MRVERSRGEPPIGNRAVGCHVLFMYHFDQIVPDPVDTNIL